MAGAIDPAPPGRTGPAPGAGRSDCRTTFTTPDGKVYRPSMFVTVTLPSYGPVTPTGAPVNPATYDYRRAALDALHFPKLVDRLGAEPSPRRRLQGPVLRRLEPQRRLAPHLHAAIRGAIPRKLLLQVIAASYEQIWGPAFDQPVYTDRRPVWDGGERYATR